MVRGIYAAATGMLAQQAVQDALAGNLANINTAGYKQDIPTFRMLREMALRRYTRGAGDPGVPVGTMGMGATFDRTVTDMAPGPLENTRNPFDLALHGSGFFAVQTPRGERYTRAGQFHVAPAGNGPDGKPASYLVDDSGNRVLGLQGPINLGGANDFVVQPDGTVLTGGAVIDRLKLVDAPNTALIKEGGNLFALRGAPIPSTARVRQGFLEKANFSVVSSMVKMITVQRAYEAAQRAIHTQDDALNKVVNEVART
ncbi:MAG TPA: flagellar hook-basal body protein [Chthonomonadales bacterium]|nr:flagellar hook-basal body protein [Chthonomonadales bacterium]